MLRNALAGRLCTGRTRMIQTVSQHWEGPRVRSSPVATHSTLQELYEVTRQNLALDGQIASDGVQDVTRALSRRQHHAAYRSDASQRDARA